jgi:hypothetical protein
MSTLRKTFLEASQKHKKFHKHCKFGQKLCFLNFYKIFDKIKEKVVKSMTIEKMVNLDFKKGICKETTLFNFLHSRK